LCRRVAFEADPPALKFVRCHCSRCRKASGSAFAANLYVAPQGFRWLQGEELVVRFDLAEARSFSAAHCRACGAPLPHATRSGREMIIPAGSLDADPGVSPTLECCWESRAPWLSDVADPSKSG
jgi:hypothetical protein